MSKNQTNPESWIRIREMAERDSKEGKFHVIANVAVLAFVANLFQDSPNNILTDPNIRTTFAILVSGAISSGMVYALSHVRARSIDAILAGPEVTAISKFAHFFACNRALAMVVVGGFIWSLIALGWAILRILLFSP